MTVHNLKVNIRQADAKWAGERPFELRFNDRDFQKGDHVIYRVVNSKTHEDVASHPLNGLETEITHVLAGVNGIEKNWCIFQELPAQKKANQQNTAATTNATGTAVKQ